MRGNIRCRPNGTDERVWNSVGALRCIARLNVTNRRVGDFSSNLRSDAVWRNYNITRWAFAALIILFAILCALLFDECELEPKAQVRAGINRLPLSARDVFEFVADDRYEPVPTHR